METVKYLMYYRENNTTFKRSCFMKQLFFLCLVTAAAMTTYAGEYPDRALFIGVSMNHPGPTLSKPYDEPAFLASGLGGHVEMHVINIPKITTVSTFDLYGFQRSEFFGASASGTGILASLGLDYLIYKTMHSFAVSVGAQVGYHYEKTDFSYPDFFFSTSGGRSQPPSGVDVYHLVGIGPVLDFTLFRFVNIRGVLPLLIPVSCSRTIDYVREEGEGELDVSPGVAPRFSVSFGWGW
jgi:hypothetical protein